MRPTPSGWVGLIIMVVAVLAAALAPVIAPYDPLVQDVAARLRPPLSLDSRGGFHLLGTDQLGRDLLSRIIYGARVSRLVAAAAVPISLVIGTTLGVTAGYFRGFYDNVVMRLLDVQLAMPFILAAFAILVAIGPSFTTIILLLGITGWTHYGRIVRGEVLSLREREFVTSARAVGAASGRIIWRHLLPNTASLLTILVSLQVPHVMILESALSFLGAFVGRDAQRGAAVHAAAVVGGRLPRHRPQSRRAGGQPAGRLVTRRARSSAEVEMRLVGLHTGPGREEGKLSWA